jgi:TOMM system kinase/cyclase fusion protein
MQFALSDDGIEALKDELIYAKKRAVDEDNRVLVWTGNGEGTAEAPAPPPQAIPAPLPQDTSSIQPTSPSITSRTPEAERRQLTVMFCDLVDSTQLSSQLDPEHYRDVVRAYQRVCSEVIQRYEGHIAQLLGDGLLVYFGYPQAHEDDAQRAVRAGLGMLAAMGDLNTRLQREKGIQLAIRIGIHTGLVVVGEMGGVGRQEQLALGETPNIAARIQGLAQPNTVAISEATYRLIQGYFDCEALGAQALRGVAEPLHVYRVLQDSGARGRLDVAVTRGLTPLVGRESEVTLLLERWEQVKAGHGQVVLLTGDAGIGKSRLVQVLKEHVAHDPHMRWECRSVEHYQNTPLFPLTDLFQRLLQFQAEDTPDEKLAKLEHALSQYRLPLEESVQLFAPLLSLPVPENRYPLLNLSPQRQRQKTLETIVTILLELAERQPVLLIVEDLHWTDPTTLELLGLLLDQTPTASLLVFLTCRPHFQPAWHHRSYLTEITVHHLSHAQVEQIVVGVTDGKSLPAEVLQQILEKTDGVPLFVEEMTKAILESGQLTAIDGHYELVGSLSTFTLPASLQDSLMARLDRLISAKGIAQLAAVIGRQFAYDLLSTVSQLDAATLQRELGRLVEAEIVYQRGVPPQVTYIFKHALIQDTAYQSLLKSTRQHYHHHIAQVLEAQFPETTEAQPELLAHHFTEAGLTEQAVSYWYKAGRSAVQRSAHVEAISHLHTGLTLLQALPETSERLQSELLLQVALGRALMVTHGYGSPDVGEVYNRARALCKQIEKHRQLFSILRGLATFYSIRADFQTAQDLGEQCLVLAQSDADPSRLLRAHELLGRILAYRGELTRARTHLEHGLALSDTGQGTRAMQDTHVTCWSVFAVALWKLGYPDQARQRSGEAQTLAHALSHPFILAEAVFFATRIHIECRDVQQVRALTETLITLATAQGFPNWVCHGMIFRGWARVMQGHGEEAIVQIQQGLAAWRSIGGELARPYYLALLAEAHETLGAPEAGLAVLTEALTHVDTTGERSYESELHRLKGELLLQQNSDNQTEAESCFQQALDLARNQQAKSFALRAATSLARLWQSQGKRQEAHDLLAPVYNWFTEGFDTADLKDAKALLDALGEQRHDV